MVKPTIFCRTQKPDTLKTPSYFPFLLLLCWGLSSFNLTAQVQEQSFLYAIPGKNDVHRGKIRFVVLADKNRSLPTSGAVDFNNAASGMVSIQIENLELASKRHYKDINIWLLQRDFSTQGGIAEKATFKNLRFSLDDDQKLEQKDAGSRTIDFRIINNGSGKLKLGIVPLGKKEDNFGPANSFVEVPLKVTGIYEAPPEPEDESIAAWELAKPKGKNAWCQYLSTYPKGSGEAEARRLLADHDRREWRSIQKPTNEEDGKALRAYREKLEDYRALFDGCSFQGDYISEAKKQIEWVNGMLPKLEEEYKAWQLAKSQNTIEGYENYLAKYANTEEAEDAREAIFQLKPAKCEVENLGNRKHMLRLEFMKNARFKDLSKDDGLIINASRLKEDNELVVEFGERGEFTLLFEDEYGKTLTVSLSDRFMAEVSGKPDSLIQVRFIGGEKPYEVVLVSARNGQTLLTKTDIQSGSITLNVQELEHINGLAKVLVTDKYAPSPIEIGQLDFPVEKTGNWLTIVIIALLAIIILGLSVTFLRLRSKRRPVSMYN